MVRHCKAIDESARHAEEADDEGARNAKQRSDPSVCEQARQTSALSDTERERVDDVSRETTDESVEPHEANHMTTNLYTRR